MDRIQRVRRNRAFKKLIIILNIIFIIFVLGIIYLKKHYVLNLSPSIPVGFYRILEDKNYKKGDFIEFKIPTTAEKYVHGRNYLSKNIKTLSKQIVGVTGDKIEVKKKGNTNYLYINNILYGYIASKDNEGLPLPVISNQIIKENEYFVLGTHPQSFDSRYYGTVSKNLILHKIKK